MRCWGENLWLSKTLQKWPLINKVNNMTPVWIVRIEEANVWLEILTRPRHTRTEINASKGGVRRETCPEQPHKHEQESAKKYIKYKQAAVIRFCQNFEKKHYPCMRIFRSRWITIDHCWCHFSRGTSWSPILVPSWISKLIRFNFFPLALQLRMSKCIEGGLRTANMPYL